MSASRIPRSLRTTIAGIVVAVLATAAIPAADALRLRPLTSLYVDSEGTGLHEPHGIACGGDTVAVADSGNGRIVLYVATDGILRATANLTSSQVPYPIAVALSGDGDVLALDGRSRRIARLTRAGEFVGFLSPKDPGVGDVVPRSLALGPAGDVYVLDVGRDRIVALADDGTVTRTISYATGGGFLSDLTVAANGDVYAVDSVARRLYAARAGEDTLGAITEVLTEDVDFPTAIAIDEANRLFVIDEHGSGVVFFGPDGSFRGRQLTMGWKEGFLRYPSDTCVDGSGRLFVAERGNDRVQVFEIR